MLRVRDRYQTYAELPFRVDTQADVSTIPVRTAEREAVPFTRQRPGVARGITGKVNKCRGRIQVLIAEREHDWPCDFTEPAVDAETNQPMKDLTPVLGRAGFLDEYAMTVDNGFLIITRLGPLRRWFRRCLHAIWTQLGMVHPLNKPL